MTGWNDRPSCWNYKLTKLWVEKMASWQNGTLTKWQDKIRSQFAEIKSLQNGKLTIAV